MNRFNQVTAWAILGLLIATPVTIADEKPTPEQVNFFESKIRPVLARECYGCHSASGGQTKGGLWLDNAEGARAGGDSGPAVVPGNLDESLLWSAINHEDFQMPPRKMLPADVLDDFKTWIQMGAPDPRTQIEMTIKSSITADDIAQGKEFWSFQRPQKSPVPTMETATESNWPRTDIDRFVSAKLGEHQLSPAPDAEASTVLRRLFFDLIGLPPTPAQIEQFLSDWKQDQESALTKMVDQLLAQPQFGERWGRHWLDVARYAESTGKELNLTFPQAWRYRDYVFDSFNDDKPYDRFLQEQIAGDLLPVNSDEQWSQNLVATGFLAMGPKTLTEQNARQFQLDLIDEQIDVTTRVMLGVSVACARCHDHKFDPIPQTDYYAVAGIFRSMSTHYGTFSTQQNRRASNLVMLPVADLSSFDKPISTEQLAKLKTQLADKRVEMREVQRARAQARMGIGQNSQTIDRQSIVNFARLSSEVGMLESKVNSYDESGNPLTYCMAVQESDSPINARLLERGEFDKPAQEVERGFPQVLCDEPPTIAAKSSGRLEFARWIGSEQNPLTARVMVNRVWLHLFGNGLVRTPEDFGSTGQPPTHPELLDYLAVELMENNWSVKSLIREIVLSRVYRMSSRFDESSFQSDPENKFLWRMEPKRLEAEVIRDSMLTLSGRLDLKRPRASLVAEAGPAIARDGILISTSVNEQMGMTDRKPGDRLADNMLRRRTGMSDSSLRPSLKQLDRSVNYRSIYLPIVRDNAPRSLDVFDFAESTLVIGQREASNTPDQGLYFLNNEFVIEQSDAMARRLIRDNDRVTDQIKQAFLWAYGRPGTSSELRAAGNFYRVFRPTGSAFRSSEIEFKKLSAVCQSIMASAEFRFLN